MGVTFRLNTDRQAWIMHI